MRHLRSLIIGISFIIAGTALAGIDPKCINILSQYTRESARWSEVERHVRERDIDLATTFTDKEYAAFDSLVKHVPDPQMGFAAKIMMMRRALYTIDLATYQFKYDKVGAAVMRELKDALDRGVSIRLLVDSFSSKRMVYSDFRALLHYEPKGPNPSRVEVVVFNPVLNIRPVIQRWFAYVYNLFVPKSKQITPQKVLLNRRMHDKFLGIDLAYPELAIAMFGGRNINEMAHSIPEPRSGVYMDTETIVRNAPGNNKATSLESTIGAYYDKMYFHLGNHILSEKFLGLFNFKFDREHERFDRIHKEIVESDSSQAAIKLKAMLKDKFLDEGFSPASAEFVDEIQNITRQNRLFNMLVKDPVNEKKNGASVIGNLKKDLAKAKKSILISSPYLLLTIEEIEWLKGWLAADPTRTLTILGNSISTTDDVIAQTLLDKMVAPELLRGVDGVLSKGQIRILAYGKLDDVRFGGDQIYGLMHSKFVIIDGETVLATTSNGDVISRKTNSEIGFLFRVATALAESFKKQARDIESKSYIWGSEEWEELRRTGHSNRIRAALQPAVAFVFEVLGLKRLK